MIKSIYSKHSIVIPLAIITTEHRFDKQLKVVYGKFFPLFLPFSRKFCWIEIFIIPYMFIKFVPNIFYWNHIECLCWPFQKYKLFLEMPLLDEFSYCHWVTIMLKQIVGTTSSNMAANDLARNPYIFHHSSYSGF